MALMAQKEQRALQQDSSLKRGKSHKKRKTRKRCRTYSSSQSRSPPRRRKKRNKSSSKSKRSEGEDPLVRLRRNRRLIPRALRVIKKTKKPRDFTLYQMKINVNGTSRLSLHLMQTFSLRKTYQRKAFMAQSVKYIPYQIT